MAREMTQEQLAAILGVRQAAVSKLERRADMYVSTLRSVIKAMGGRRKYALSSPTTARWRLTSSPPPKTSAWPLFADCHIRGEGISGESRSR